MSTMQRTMTRREVADLARRYADAWNEHEVDALISMHAEDSVFCTYMGGEEVRGIENIRQAFEVLFTMWPDIEFHSRRLYIGDDVIVHEYDIEGTLAHPMPLGPITVEPNGERLRYAAVDVIAVADGLVQRKDVYLDLVSAQIQAGVFSPA
jgi:steroid delta-isomerase-like uncharacterized protein